MTSDSGPMDVLPAVVVALVVALSVITVIPAGSAGGPQTLDDKTSTGAVPTNNTTQEAPAATAISTDASVWATADTALADQPGDASIARAQLDLVGNLNAIADDSSRSQRDQTLDTAEAVLEQRQQWAASADKPLPASLVPTFEATQTKLDGTAELLETNDELQDADGLTRSVALAKRATTMQAAQADDSVTLESGLPAIETPDHESPSAATLELLDRYGITPTAEDLATMQELDDLPEPARSELTDYLDAYLAFQQATAERDVTKTFAARNQMLDEVQDLNEALENTDGPGLVTPQHSGVGPVGVCGPKQSASTGNQVGEPDGRNATVTAGACASASGSATNVGPGNLSPSKTYVGCVKTTTPTVDGKLDARPTQFGADKPLTDTHVKNGSETTQFCALQIGDDSSQTYDHNTIVLIDQGGSDTYKNNAGGTNLDDNCQGVITLNDGPSDNNVPTDSALEAGMAAALVDLGTSGDDYVGKRGVDCGQRGGAHIGSAFLLDAGGSDTYGNQTSYDDPADTTDNADAVDRGVNGGAFASVVNSSSCCQYVYATGFLLDADAPGSAAGPDTYNAGRFGTNGGGSSGLAFGTDPRTSYGFLMDTGGSSTYRAGARGTNGGGSGGNGFLADLGSSTDTYRAESAGTNGGGNFQAKHGGFLLDAGGGDEYTATSMGTNGGGMNRGAGFLVDATQGTDSSAQDDFITGHAAKDGLRDTPIFDTGPISRQAGFIGVNGGAKEPSVGTLIDIAGLSRYQAGDGQGANGGAYANGAGLLVDGGNDDDYIVGTDPTEGSTWDNDPTVRFPSAGSNGGGAVAGVGAVMDADGSDTFIAMDGHKGGVNGTNGGAWALGGGAVGLVANPDGTDTYEANATDGPVTGANGGGSGYGQAGLLEAKKPACDFIEDNTENVSIGPITCPDSTAIRATGTLVDADGAGDQYIADATDAGEPVAGSNGGAFGQTSIGVLVDVEGGGDNYTALGNSNSDVAVNGGVNSAASVDGVGAGLLLDAAGSNDAYKQNGCNSGNVVEDDTWLPKGIAGAQIDKTGTIGDTNIGCGSNE